jgi:WD40 repeat protein/serine/threonine protein kinase
MDRLTESAHPSVEILRSFGLGQLGEAEAEAVEDHVSHCEACCRTLARTDSDTFTDLLRNGRLAAASEAVTQAPGLPRPVADGGRTTAESSAESGPPPELLRHPRYRVLSLLGAGGMGAVYKAEHRLMERTVALKVMTRAFVASEATVDRFRREVKAAARLSHPNIVAAYDAEQAGDVHFLVMEYVEGTDLARWLAARGPLPVEEACEYARQCATGLRHAHEHGMIHRDIKPHNLMRTPGGTIKILDFGLARLAAEAGTAGGVTGQGILLGTVDYLAPEQADDARQADIRSDIYSLGCTLYHLLSGRPPFPKGTVVQKIMAHTEREPSSLRELRPDLPPGVARLVQRMMAKSPDDRYQTPDEVCDALAPFAGQTVVIDPSPRRTKRAGMEPRGTRRWSIAAAAVLLALVGIVAGAAVYRIQTDNGEIVISTDNPDVEVVIKQNGKLVRIIDTKTNKEVKLDSGLYDLELGGQADGLKLSPDRVTIRRGETVVATVERRPKGGDVTGKKAEPPAEIRRDAFTGSENVPAHVFWVTFSPDGRYFLATGDAGNRSPVRIYDGKTGQLISQFVPDVDTGASYAAFSPDGTKVVSSDRAAAYVWESAKGRRLLKLEGHKERPWYATFSPDGKRILTGSFDHTLRVWDAATGKELLVLEGHADTCGGYFSPDGKWIVSYSADKTTRGWDAATGKEVWKQTEQRAPLNWFLNYRFFSPDGARVLSLGGDGGVRVLEVATGKVVSTLTGTAEVDGASFLPDGLQLVTWGKDRALRIWDLASSKEVRSLDLAEDLADDYYDKVAVSPNGQSVLTSHKDQTVRLRDLATGKELHRYPSAPARSARSLAFSPDGRFAAAGSFRGWVYLWRLPDPPQLEKVGEVRRFIFYPQRGWVTRAAFSPDGRRVVAASGDVHVWDAASGEALLVLGSASNMFGWGLALAPDGKTAYHSTDDGVVHVLDLEKAKEVGRLDAPGRGTSVVELSADGKRILITAIDAEKHRLCEVPDGKELARLEGGRNAALSPDGTRVALVRKKRIVLWDVALGKEAGGFDIRLEGHLPGLRFTPDGLSLMAAGEGPQRTVVCVWDVATGKERANLNVPDVPAGKFLRTAVSPDGRHILSCPDPSFPATNRPIILWDAATAKEVCRFAGPENGVFSLAFSPDGRSALASGTDGTVRLFRLPDPQAK